MSRLLASVTATCVFVSGCAMTSSAGNAPALVMERSAQSHIALERAVASLLGRPVLLASDALTNDSTLIVERVSQRDPSGRKVEVRDDLRPEIFRLSMQGTQCMLVRQNTQQSVRLDNVRCVPAQK